MHRRRVANLDMFVALIAAISLAGVTLAGQTAAPKKGTPAPASRAADGRPDLSGIWEHNAATPLERPDELGDRATLTDNEVAQLAAKAGELFNGDGDAGFGDSIYIAALRNILGKEKGFKSTDITGNYNAFWVVGRWFETRTSLISDPPNGKLPPLTADAKKRQAAAAERRKLHPYDGPEDISLGQRCITGNVPMLGAGYNNYYQIVQSPTVVALNMEMRHDTRVIPITNRPHLPSNVHLWLGDPIGRWEGDTFVVDSTNFRGDSPVTRGGGGSEQLHLIERFTRVNAETLKYEVTVDDPGTWTKPWTAVLLMKSTTDQIYEYACHEANEAMYGTLNGTRVQEKNAREKATKSTTSSR